MPMRRRMALMSVDRAMRSTPSIKIDPPVGSSRRLQQRSSELLRQYLEIDPAQHLEVAEALAQAANLENRRPIVTHRQLARLTRKSMVFGGTRAAGASP